MHEERDTLRACVTRIHTDAAAQMLQPLSLNMQNQMAKHHKHLNVYASQATEELIIIEKLNEEISDIEHQILEQKKIMGGVFADQEDRRSKDKQIKILENRLDQTLKSHNQQLTSNRKIRREIDGLKSEATAFKGLTERMEQELDATKKKIARVVERHNMVHEQGVSAKDEHLKISQMNRLEEEEFEREMNQFGKMLNDELRLKIPGIEMPDTTAVPAESAFEETLERRINLGTARSKADVAYGTAEEVKERTEKLKKNITMYEDILTELPNYLGTSDIHEAIRIYSEREENNVSLLSRVNVQGNELAALEETLEFMRLQREALTNERSEKEAWHREETKNLMLIIEANKLELHKSQKKMSQDKEALEEFMDTMALLLDQLGCKLERNKTETIFSPNASSGVTEDNIVDCFRVLERRLITGSAATRKHTQKLGKDVRDEFDDIVDENLNDIDEEESFEQEEA